MSPIYNAIFATTHKVLEHLPLLPNTKNRQAEALVNTTPMQDFQMCHYKEVAYKMSACLTKFRCAYPRDDRTLGFSDYFPY